MTDKQVITFTNNGRPISEVELRSYVANSNDINELRSLAATLLHNCVELARWDRAYEVQVRAWQRKVQEEFRRLAARSAPPEPPPAPTVVIQPGAVVLNVSPPEFNFASGALAVHAEAPRTGTIIEYDDKGRVSGTRPKVAP